MKALIILMHARVVSNENIMKHEEVKVRAQSKVSKFIFIFILSMFFLYARAQKVIKGFIFVC